MRRSSESNQAGRAGRGLRVKVNLPIFKDEKTKDPVTYHSWWWDVAIFYCSGWDNQHLLPYIFWSLEGFPGDLTRSLGKDATLTDILQTLDEHYGMVMMFGALSKELFSLKQGSRENVAKFGVHLFQQVQILQSEYPGRIQQEHVEEMKQHHFHEGLIPKYWCMMALKVNGEHPGSYSWLAPCSLEVVEMGRSQRSPAPKDYHNWRIKCYPASDIGELVPSRKLKGSHTFMAQSAIVESIRPEENLSIKPEGEEVAESSVGECNNKK